MRLDSTSTGTFGASRMMVIPSLLVLFVISVMGCRPGLSSPSDDDSLLLVGRVAVAADGRTISPKKLSLTMECMEEAASEQRVATLGEGGQLFAFADVPASCVPAHFTLSIAGQPHGFPYVPTTIRAEGTRFVALASLELELLGDKPKSTSVHPEDDKLSLMDEVAVAYDVGSWGSIIDAERPILQKQMALLTQANEKKASDETAALAVYEQAWRLDPTNPAACEALGGLAGALGASALEEEVLLVQVALDPKNTDHARRLAELFEGRGADKDALEVLTNAAALAPTETKLTVALATLSMKLGDSDTAKQVWASFVSQPLGDSQGLREHYDFQKSLGTPEVGIEALEQWVAEHPSNKDGVSALVWTYQDTGQPAKAKAAIAKAKETLSKDDYAALLEAVGTEP